MPIISAHLRTYPVQPERQAGHRCGEGDTGDYTLCGLAHDAHDTGDEETIIIIARKGETVNCPNCLNHIRYVINSFPNNRFRG